MLEDFTRFVLDDARLSEDLKVLRHDFAAAARPFLAAAVLHRDTQADVGTAITTPGEQSRQSVAHVVRAATKRLTEALRSLEEFGKIDHPSASKAIEALRYRAYILEQQLELRLARLDSPDLRGRRLCVLITESACKHPWQEVAMQVLQAGAPMLQLREKSLESGEFLRRAAWLSHECRRHDAVLIVNDRPDVALLAGAHGVHVGQDDLPPLLVRQLIGPGMLLGVSTHNMEQAQAAQSAGADYIGCGPIFKSPTKPREFLPGLSFASEIGAAAGRLAIPAYGIAGITPGNVQEVLRTGITHVAITSAITGSEVPGSVTREILSALGSGSLPADD